MAYIDYDTKDVTYVVGLLLFFVVGLLYVLCVFFMFGLFFFCSIVFMCWVLFYVLGLFMCCVRRFVVPWSILSFGVFSSMTDKNSLKPEVFFEKR